MRIAALMVITLLAAPMLRADELPAVEAVKKVAWLAGTWEGSGWIAMRGGEKTTFRQREVVRLAAGGLVLVIEGQGTAPDSGKVTHDAFAVVDYDPVAKKYRWHSWRAGGGDAIDEPEVGEGRFVWGMSPPAGGRIRYTISRTAEGAWLEIGEFSRDGEKWSKFFEMTLTKK